MHSSVLSFILIDDLHGPFKKKKKTLPWTYEWTLRLDISAILYNF